MEDRTSHRILIALIVLALGFPWAPKAFASTPQWDDDISVTTDPGGFTVDVDGTATIPGSPSGDGSTGDGGSDCTLVGVVEAGGDTLPFIKVTHDSNGDPVYWEPYEVVCKGVPTGEIVWLPIRTDDPTPIRDDFQQPDPYTLARQLQDKIPVPSGTIKTNPTPGLVGLESWYWIDGYDGDPIRKSITAYGNEIEVLARVDRYRWVFGDGTKAYSETPGQAYPRRSSVRHTYQRSSYDSTAGYRVRLYYEFECFWRLNHSSWRSLPSITRTTAIWYPVRESQAVIGQ